MVRMSAKCSPQREQVDRNYEVFVKALPELAATKAGRTVLMKDGEFIAFFDTDRDAIEAGRRLLSGQPFSVHEITERPVDLGYFSHVGSLGTL